MQFDETRELLKLITAYDQRTTGPADIAAWFSAVSDLDLDDCQSAVVMHYRSTDQRVMPSHIRELVKGTQAEQHPSAKAIPPVIRYGEDVARRGSDLARLHIGVQRKHLDEPLAFADLIPDGGLHAAVVERREMVLRHPDVARRLCEPPLSFKHPSQWNGFVPPELWAEQFNDSPRRAALLDICREAEAYDAAHV